VNPVSSPNSELIRFPALSFDQGWLGVIESMDGLSRPSRLGVKKGFYSRVVLVDSNGNRFQVVDAKKVRTLFSFSFRAFLGLIGGNPIWQMELKLGPPAKASLDEVKQLISDRFKSNEEYWDEMSQFEEFRDRIAAANSLDEVFIALKEARLF